MTFIPDLAESKKKYYFCNELVEFKMTKYLWSGCTNVTMRNSIMEHANELITQLIRKQRLFVIYNGHDPSSFAELVHVAYMQIERTLYKYRSVPHCRSCFTYDRPNNSVLYEPGKYEYGIIKPYRLIELIDRCPHCGADLTVGVNNIIEPQQGLYGGTDALCYRGLSKVFNLWCVSPESLIITNNGIEEIGDTIDYNRSNGIIDGVEYGDYSGQVFTEKGLHNVIKWAKRINVETIKISTKFGYNVKASLDHQFFVLGQSGIQKIRAEDLQEGMLLGIQYNQQQFGNIDTIDFKTTVNTNCKSWIIPTEWTSDLAYLIGLIVSEGFVVESAKYVAICNTEVGNFLESQPCGLKFTSDGKTIVYKNSSKVFCEFVQWLGIKSGASTKTIPKQILKCSKPIIAAFLRGLFDGDGHSKRNNGSVGYTSTSLKLIDQLRVVLANFGIMTKQTIDNRNLRQLPTNQKISKLLTAYQLTLPAIDSRIFYNEIGFDIERKQQKQEKLPSTGYKLIDRITSTRIQEITRSISFTDFKRISGSPDMRQNIAKKERLTIETFNKLFKMFPEFEQNDFLADRYKEYVNDGHKILWLPIERIEDAGISDTVDIEVPETGSFVVNNITCRNSQVSRTVILAYVKKDTRDTRNGDNYTIHINKKPDQNNNELFVNALKEAKNEMWFNEQYCSVVSSLIELSSESDAEKNLKRKLIDMSGQPKNVVEDTLSVLKVMMDLYSEQFDNGKLGCS